MIHTERSEMYCLVKKVNGHRIYMTENGIFLRLNDWLKIKADHVNVLEAIANNVAPAKE